MDHREFVKNFSDTEQIKFSKVNNKINALHLAMHVGLTIALGTLIAANVPLWSLLLLPLSLLLIFLFTVEHEATHVSVFSNQKANDWVGRIIGFVILLPFEWFRYFHVEHHTFPNVPSHNLPSLHQHIESHIKVKTDGYVDFISEYSKHLGR